MQKTCCRCKQEKPLTDFRKATKQKDGHQHACRMCANKDTKRWRMKNRDRELEKGKIRRENNKEKYNAMSKKWRDANPDKVKENTIKKRYGIDLAQWQTMFDAQDGKCIICGTHQFELKKELAVDHCHTTGKVRGLLCIRCNRAIGLFRDSPDLLDKALKYLVA